MDVRLEWVGPEGSGGDGGEVGDISVLDGSLLLLTGMREGRSGEVMLGDAESFAGRMARELMVAS